MNGSRDLQRVLVQMSDDEGKRGKPWDGYVEEAEEREYMEVLRRATIALQKVLAGKGIASALIHR